MIDYATFQRIQHLHRVEQLTVVQIAHAIALDARTVRRWLDEPRFRPRLPEPSALHLTRRADLLELELPQPDLSLYDPPGGPRDDTP